MIKVVFEYDLVVLRLDLLSLTRGSRSGLRQCQDHSDRQHLPAPALPPTPGRAASSTLRRPACNQSISKPDSQTGVREPAEWVLSCSTSLALANSAAQHVPRDRPRKRLMHRRSCLFPDRSRHPAINEDRNHNVIMGTTDKRQQQQQAAQIGQTVG